MTKLIGRQLRLGLLFMFLLLAFSLEENPFRQPRGSSPPPPIPQGIVVEKWQQELGRKMINLRQAIPTVSRVVLVPDAATFLSAIQEWNLEQRYPILIEDDRYTPLFLNHFQPQEVIRLPAVEPSFIRNRKSAMQNAVAAAWESKEKTLVETWKKLEWEPPGVVITSVHDPASVAAVALAADRGQPLLFLEGYFGRIDQILPTREWQHLKQEINYLIQSTGYEYKTLGDTIDTMTIVRDLPAKYRSPKNQELLAVTDGLARNENGKRYAIAGWIFGSPERAVYQAMCAIFLDAERALLYDSYPETPAWQEYHFQQSQQLLEQLGLNVKHIKQPEASQETWRKLITQPWDYDLAFINSRGGKDNFSVGKGGVFLEDIPTLHTPTAMHMIHSFSATMPNDQNTVAGRWLNNGVYAYVGSVDEPYVSGFMPPKYVIAQLLFNVPFLVASRYTNAPPWKITTIGDPLMFMND